jgi:ribosomal protein L11 methyltransferase
VAHRVRFVVGAIDEVAPPDERFPLVVANLLKREILPIAAGIARRVAPGGLLVLSGLLEEDVDEVLERFAAEGLAGAAARRECVDGTGRWVGLCLGEAPPQT